MRPSPSRSAAARVRATTSVTAAGSMALPTMSASTARRSASLMKPSPSTSYRRNTAARSGGIACARGGEGPPVAIGRARAAASARRPRRRARGRRPPRRTALAHVGARALGEGGEPGGEGAEVDAPVGVAVEERGEARGQRVHRDLGHHEQVLDGQRPLFARVQPAKPLVQRLDLLGLVHRYVLDLRYVLLAQVHARRRAHGAEGREGEREGERERESRRSGGGGGGQSVRLRAGTRPRCARQARRR